MRARFNGGAWATIATSVDGAFSGVLAGQVQGQGTLEIQTSTDGVNWSGSCQRLNVGIGDIFVVAGQSNAVGYGTLQSYSHATLKAGLFKNSYVWANLTDPTDDVSGQVDAISLDVTPSGSIWPLLATSFLTDEGVPCAFIPCAKASTSVQDWLPTIDHQDRATLYGSMVYRALAVGGVKAVLWWQGEQNVTLATSEADYLTSLQALGDAIDADLGVPLVASTLHNYASSSAAWQAIVDAQMAAWGTHNIVAGPNVSDIVAVLHITGSDMQTVADRWWTALTAAFYS